MAVVQALVEGALAVAGDPTEHRPVRDPGEFEPQFDGSDRTGLIIGPSPELDRAPAGFAFDLQQGATGEDFEPAGTIWGLKTALRGSKEAVH
ncbi:MAG: hypothetical protein P4M00_12080 [Azospirillaceae bacterium]|nr:hypothetical protein [Azospirillaceae bacterium]